MFSLFFNSGKFIILIKNTTRLIMNNVMLISCTVLLVYGNLWDYSRIIKCSIFFKVGEKAGVTLDKENKTIKLDSGIGVYSQGKFSFMSIFINRFLHIPQFERKIRVSCIDPSRRKSKRKDYQPHLHSNSKYGTLSLTEWFLRCNLP